MLSAEAKAYLTSRGYTEKEIADEEFCDLPIGEAEVQGVKVFTEVRSLAAVCRSMSEGIAAVHTLALGREKKDYRMYQASGCGYLPPIYGSRSDRDIFFVTKEMTLVEGLFDRIPIKRAFPNRAVFARLTKGATGQMVETLQVYCDLLWEGFDQDEFGAKAAEKGEKKLRRLGIRVNVLKFPRKDPGLLWERGGLDAVKKALEPQYSSLGF